MGFAIASGIADAAFAMAMFFAPTLTPMIGHTAWWPGHGDDPEHGRAGAPSGPGRGPGASGDAP